MAFRSSAHIVQIYGFKEIKVFFNIFEKKPLKKVSFMNDGASDVEVACTQAENFASISRAELLWQENCTSSDLTTNGGGGSTFKSVYVGGKMFFAPD